MIDLQEVKQGGVFKFVRIDGMYRFVPPEGCHADAVKEGEKAESAGLIGIRDDFWKFLDTWSISLRVGTSIWDVDGLTRLLERPHQSRY